MRVIYLLGFLAIALLIAAAVILATTDLNRYRELLTDGVQAATGRELVLAGDLELELSLRPSLTVSGVGLANAPWGTRPNMLSAERLAVRVALLPLLAGELRVLRLELTGVDLWLETDGEGKGNWLLARDTPAPESGLAGVTTWAPSVDEVRVQRCKIGYRDAASPTATIFDIESLSAKAKDAASPLVIEATGRHQAIPLALQGTLRNPAELMAGRPVRIDFSGNSGETRFTLQGSIAAPLRLSGLDLSLSARGEAFAEIRRRLGLPGLAEGPWGIALRLADTPDGFRLGDIALRAGKTDLSGTLNLARGTRPVSVTGTIQAGTLDLRPLAVRSAAGAANGAPPGARRDRLFNSTPLPLGALKDLDAALAFHADTLIVPKLTLAGVEGEVRLAGGVLTLDPLQGMLEGSRADATLSLDASKRIPHWHLKLSAQRLDSGRLLKRLLDEDVLTGQADLALDLQARGDSVAAIMASLDGHARLLIGRGTAKAQAVDSLVGGLSKVFGTLVAKQSDTATLNCLATDFTIKDGVATSRVMLADTEYSTVVGNGHIDLGEETLGLVIKPKPKSVTLNVAVPVEVGGTLTAPTFTPEKFSTARKLVGVLAAVGALSFPPAALAGLVELGTGEDNPCLNIARGDKPPATAGKETANPGADQGSGVGRAIRGIGNKLKGLFGD